MNIPTDTIFGVGSLNLLHAQKLPGKKSMIVISNGKSTKSNGYLDRVENELKQINIDFIVFDKIQANPLKATVEEGAALARNNNCDFIIALGGGSVMDAAKVIAMLTNETGDLWDYVPFGKGKGLPRKNKALPIVCITTTAGTGSEVDQYGVITNPDTHEKIGIGFNDMFPVIAIVDPELMLTVPPKFTAYQGFDALFHSTEGYISKFANPVSEMFSLNAIKNISSNLPTCVNDGKNINAREKVAFGNTLSGYEMVTGSTSSKHSMEHAMSAYHQELPHGAGLIMISKAYYTHFINAHACDDRFIKMAKVMGIKNASDPNDFITALMKLQNDCGVADLKMSDYNIETDEFDTLATNAKESMGALFECDRIKLSHDDVVNIYKNSYK
jgi:alcohol dehydrogenase